MVCLIKKNNKLRKKFLIDFWNYGNLNLKKSKLIKFRFLMEKINKERLEYYRKEFTFDLSNKINFLKRDKFKKKYIRPRLLYTYFLFLRRKMFLRYAYKAKRRNGYFFRNYLVYLEGRLFMLIYRSNFITNIFKLKFIIDRGIFLVNNVKRYYVNYIVNIGDLIQVDFSYKNILQDDLKIRLKYFLSLQPKIYRYMYVNYKFMFIYFLRAPKFKEIKYPLKLDLYLGSNLYYL